jgi:hypothetical protein
MAHPEPAWLHERDGRDHSTGSTVGYQVVQYRPRRTAVVHSGVKPSELPAFFNRALSSVLAAMEAQATLPAGEPFSPYHVMQPDGVVKPRDSLSDTRTLPGSSRGGARRAASRQDGACRKTPPLPMAPVARLESHTNAPINNRVGPKPNNRLISELPCARWAEH